MVFSGFVWENVWDPLTYVDGLTILNNKQEVFGERSLTWKDLPEALTAA